MSRSLFIPQGRALARNGGIDIRNVRCPCGVMHDVTTSFVAAVGAAHYECDTCHQRRGILCKPTPRN